MRLLDTVLRDGNQVIRPRISVTEENQAEQFRTYAKAAGDFGMHFIEAGIPIAGPQSQAIVRAISGDFRDNARSTILGFSRAKESEIDLVSDTVQQAARKGIALLTSVSDLQLDKFGSVAAKSLPEKRSKMLEVFRNSVRYARSHPIDELLVYLEDATRADREYLLDLCAAYIESGATIISVPDTVGHVNDPEAYAELVQFLREGTAGSETVSWSAHLHNDRGIAVATALLVARRNLVNIVEGTINGEGERAGNLALATYLLNTHVPGMAKAVPKHMRMEGLTTEKLSTLENLSTLASNVLRVPRSVYQPGHGEFSHRTAAGMHQDGLLKNAQMFASFDPACIGVTVDTPFVFSDQSGKKGLRAILEAQGVKIGDAELERAYLDAYTMATLLGGRVPDSLLHAAAWRANQNGTPPCLDIDFTELDIDYPQSTSTGNVSSVAQRVRVRGAVIIEGQVRSFEGTGNGPTSAFTDGLSPIMRELFQVSIDIKEWVERAVSREASVLSAHQQSTVGREAIVWGFSRMSIGSESVDGYGTDGNATIASMKACLQALNRWSKDQTGQPI